MKKNDIITHLEKLDFPKDQYWVLAGSALVMNDVRDTTNDIDLGCTTELFERLKQEGHDCSSCPDGSRVIRIGETVEIFENWDADEIVLIDGIPVGSLLSIRVHKVELGREKDFRDIALIDEYLESREQI